METPRMEPDGRTSIVYTPDTAAGIRALAAALKDLGEWDLRAPAPPSNERPWHKHTLPSRRRR